MARRNHHPPSILTIPAPSIAARKSMNGCFSCFTGAATFGANHVASSTASSDDASSSSKTWQFYTLKELSHATGNFREDNKIGEGGFGTVYRGRTSRGAEIAVKRLKAMTAKAEMEFALEVEILGRVRHKNLLGLRGFYAGDKERLIVYDYMPNKSISTHLHRHRSDSDSGDDKLLLDWPRRMRIAVGAAEGIAYLHNEARPQIVHRDVKSSNVLLDAEFDAKVADFGFAKLVPNGLSHVTTRVKGTLGYLAPEYAMWGKVSESCDVYSFGVLLLELVTARKPIEKLPGGARRDIVQWVTGVLTGSDKLVDGIADPRLGGRYDAGQMRAAVAVALRCTSSSPEGRPTMAEVVAMLKATVAGGDALPRMVAKELVAGAGDSDKAEEEEGGGGERGVSLLRQGCRH